MVSLPMRGRLDVNSSPSDTPHLRHEGGHVLSGQEAHVVQLYSDDNSLLDVLCRFMGGTIAVGDAGVLIATRAHQVGLDARLKAQGLDTAQVVSQGRYLSVDAAELLSRIMADGRVDETLFTEIVGELL